MRIPAAFLFSTIAACPLALITLNATGDNRVPTDLESAPAKPQSRPSIRNSAAANQPLAIAVPESSGGERSAVVSGATLPSGVPGVPTVSIAKPFRVDPQLYQRLQNRALRSAQGSIALPERLNLPWTRLVARSTGFEERTVANARQVLTTQLTRPAPTPTPPAASPVEAAPPSIEQSAISASAPAAIPTMPAPATQPTAATVPAAIDPAYRLGPGDSISVNFFNVPEYSGNQRVLVDGTINMPVVGSVSVNGLTLAEAEQAIAQSYSGELRNIRVTVSLAQSRPVRVGVAGEVRQPGYYVMPTTDVQPATVAQAIQTAGGVTQIADLRQIQVRRTEQNGAPQLITVNLWALLEQGDLSQNLTLRDGDTILISPTTNLSAAETEQLAASNLASSAAQSVNVSLVGEVGRPGVYRLDSAAGNRATLTQAIQAAGGVRPEANLRSVEVQRTARNGEVRSTTLDLWQLVTAGDLSQDLVLQPGDRITIAKAEAMSAEEMLQVTSSNVSPSSIRVGIIGEAATPGSLEVAPNTTLNQALLAAGGFNRRARHTVQLLRINPNGTVSQRRIEVDWEQGTDPENNPILFNNDVIIVGRNGLASIGDSASNILEPIFRILPFFDLFQRF